MDERAEVQKEVQDEVSQRPEQMAIATLQKGVLPDGNDFPFKLSKEDIKNDFPGFPVEKLPRGIAAGKERVSDEDVKSHAHER